jgi:predicted dehydrogenase
VETVYAEVHARTTNAEDDAFLACRHTSGVHTHLNATSVAGAPGPRVRVLGSSGAFLLNQFEQEPSIFPDLRDEDGSAGWIYRGEDREPVARQQSHQADFYRAVALALTSDDPVGNMPVDPRDALHTAAVIDAARVSAEGRRVVDVITPGERID